MAKDKLVARPDVFAPVSAAFDALSGANTLLRQRLAEIDPLDHPAKWAGVNDQIRTIEGQLGELRDEQQRLALVGAQLRELGLDEMAELHAATVELATILKASARVVAVVEAAGTLIAATSTAIRKLRS